MCGKVIRPDDDGILLTEQAREQIETLDEKNSNLVR